MILIRPTKSLAKNLNVLLSTHDFNSIKAEPLREWFANDFNLGRNKLVIFVNPSTCFGVVIKAAPFRDVVRRFCEQLPKNLSALGWCKLPIERLPDANDELYFSRAQDRSTTGVMVEFVKHIQFMYDDGDIDHEDLIKMSSYINKMPIMSRGGHYSRELFAKLLGISAPAISQKTSST